MRLTGWIVVDPDATVITSASKKAGAAVTFRKTFGFHLLAAWCANTTESLAMLLRPGNAGANTVADHIAVLTNALAQIPGSSAATILIRVDGAGAAHGLLEHLEALNTTRRTVRCTVGWRITEDDEKAIAKLLNGPSPDRRPARRISVSPTKRTTGAMALDALRYQNYRR
ncbi:transposase [Streptomyces sp. CBMA29]|uniref:transposase n=1 Tax=Streptomyces sp. CBMA29 TaxID=1896314 RepID=UPI001CB6EA99|nr:transposase [Streptomyces sp. CBMA29]